MSDIPDNAGRRFLTLGAAASAALALGAVAASPFGRIGEPEDIANVVAALRSTDGAWSAGRQVGVA